MRTRTAVIALGSALVFANVGLVDGVSRRHGRIVLPGAESPAQGGPQMLTISPDGRDVVYAANLRLYRRRLSDRQSAAIPGTDSPRGIFSPVFSPDGKSISFWSAGDQTLKRVPVAGGTPTTICQTPGILGLSWESDDRIVFGAGPQGLMRVPARGGVPEAIVTMTPGEFAAMPQVLPGATGVLFTVLTQPGPGINPWEHGRVVVESLQSHDRKIVLPEGSDAQYLENGRLVYGLAGRVMAVAFDLARLEVRGAPIVVADDVRVVGRTHFVVARNGTAAWIRGLHGQAQIDDVDLAGHRTPRGVLPDTVFAIRVSPNDQQVTFDTYDGTVWVTDLAHLPARRPLTSGGNNRFPMWAPDGQRIVFTSERGGVESLMWQRADGTGPADLLTTPARSAESWLPHGEAFSFITFKAGGDYDVWRYSIPDRKVTSLVEKPGSGQHSSQYSPDGRWLAYASNETGRFEVFVEPVPATGMKMQITTEGGGHPLWSSDGQVIYFDRSGQLFAVRVQPDPKAARAVPEPLPIMGFIQGEARRQYDRMSDGRRFLMMFPAAWEIETLRDP